MSVTNFRIDVTTDSGGAFTGFTQGPVTGRLVQTIYTPDGTNPLDTGSDLTITGESTGVVISTESNIGTSAFTRVYRQATQDTTGAAALYAAGGKPVLADIWFAGERVKLVVANGGDTKLGTFQFFFENDN